MAEMRKIDLANFQVATSETARDINRRIMLNLIRRHQPISRADLARHSGLQRSTAPASVETTARPSLSTLKPRSPMLKYNLPSGPKRRPCRSCPMKPARTPYP